MNTVESTYISEGADASAPAEKAKPLSRAIENLAAMLVNADSGQQRKAEQFAQAALQIDPTLVKEICRFIQYQRYTSEEQAIRILRVLETLTSKSELLECLLGFRNLEGRLRSKVALVVGRLVQNPVWLKTQLEDSNPRVRANAVEALWDVRAEGISTLFHHASEDPHNRVIANAAVGLQKLRDPRADSLIHRLLNHSDELYRRSGLWALTITRDFRYELYVQRSLNAKTPEECAMARRAAAALVEAKRDFNLLPDLEMVVTGLRHMRDGRWLMRMHITSPVLPSAMTSSELSRSSFVVEEDGKVAEQVELLWPAVNTEMATVVLMPQIWAERTLMTERMWPNLRDGERLALVPYQAYSNYEGAYKVGLEVGYQEASRQIQSLSRACRNLDGALQDSLRLLYVTPGRKQVIVLADSSVQQAVTPAALALAHQSEAPVHVVMPEGLDGANRELWQRLAEETGGVVWPARSIQDLFSLVNHIRATHWGTLELSWPRQSENEPKIEVRCRTPYGMGSVTV